MVALIHITLLLLMSVIDTCNEKIKEGKKILNTNLPFLTK